MAKRSIIKKLSKEQKSLLIGLLLGDGTISSNCVFKLSHSEAQRDSTKLEFIAQQRAASEARDTLELE